MNPIFWLGVLIIAFLIWLLVSYLFIPLGKAISNRAKKTKDIMESDTRQEYKEKQKNNKKENN